MTHTNAAATRTSVLVTETLAALEGKVCSCGEAIGHLTNCHWKTVQAAFTDPAFAQAARADADRVAFLFEERDLCLQLANEHAATAEARMQSWVSMRRERDAAQAETAALVQRVQAAAEHFEEHLGEFSNGINPYRELLTSTQANNDSDGDRK